MPTQAAHDRALKLFQSLLTPGELEEWKTCSRVTLTGSDGGVYRMYTTSNVVDNVYRIDPETDRRIAVLCAAPEMWTNTEYLPIADGWVGQLLALRYNEKLFLEKAVISYYRGF